MWQHLGAVDLGAKVNAMDLGADLNVHKYTTPVVGFFYFWMISVILSMILLHT
jgi:hypothetical protein